MLGDLQSQSNICLHASNDKQDEAVIIVQLENELTQKIAELKQLDEEHLKIFIQQYNEAKKQDEQTLIKQETYEKGDILFIDTVFEQKTDEKNIQTEEYYTIVDGKAIIISASFLQKQVNSVKVRQMIDSVKITQEGTSIKENLYVVIMPVILIVLLIIYAVKEKKNKVQLEENEKKKVLQNVIEYMNNKGNYSKFTGILILFVITIVLNIVNLFWGIIQLVTQNIWNADYSIITKISMVLAILQNVIQLLGVIYIAYRLSKKEEKTIRNIKKALINMLIGVSILTIIGLIMQGILVGINQNFIQYVMSQLESFIQSAMYIIIWYLYFKNSIRASIYYKEKTIEEIIMKPKKGYQTNVVNKQITESKIIEYFKKQKAFDYASGIYINKLPKEYGSSLSLSDLNSKKIIRLKRAKYYLSKKDLEDPKTEQRKMAKTIGVVIVIYLFITLLISTY